jgi:hypothetical protein
VLGHRGAVRKREKAKGGLRWRPMFLYRSGDQRKEGGGPV